MLDPRRQSAPQENGLSFKSLRILLQKRQGDPLVHVPDNFGIKGGGTQGGTGSKNDWPAKG